MNSDLSLSIRNQQVTYLSEYLSLKAKIEKKKALLYELVSSDIETWEPLSRVDLKDLPNSESEGV